MPKLSEEAILEDILYDIEDEKCILLVGPEIIQIEGKPIAKYVHEKILENHSGFIEYYYSNVSLFLFRDKNSKNRAAGRLKYIYPKKEEIKDGLLEKILQLPLPLIISLNPDTLLSDYESGYLNQIYQTEVDRKSKEVDVVFNKKLPKLSAGYYSESVVGEKFQGVQAGISIPLWENARAVKTAKAKVIYAQSDAERFWQEKENEIRQKYDQLLMLQDRVKDMEQVLSESNDEALLRQAMEAGEITLTDYYYESDFYYQTLVSLLEFRKDLLLLEAELRKVYY